MSAFLKRSAAWAGLWVSGDFLAQFYSAHKERAARKLRGEKRPGGRPTAAQMFGMLDQQRLLLATVFGAVAGPAILQYEKLIPRIFGPLAHQATPCICALGLQQLVITPAIVLSYFNFMTAAKGGFSDTSFMEAHLPRQRHDIWEVEKYIAVGVMPYPVLISWAVFVPLYLLAYCGPIRGASFLSECILVPWTSLLAYTQEVHLL